MLGAREDGPEIMIKPPNEATQFEFVGEAKPPFLQQRMRVRFTGSFHEDGVAQTPIGQAESDVKPNFQAAIKELSSWWQIACEAEIWRNRSEFADRR